MYTRGKFSNIFSDFGSCVGITEQESKRIDSYSCRRCETVAGPSKCKFVSVFSTRMKFKVLFRNLDKVSIEDGTRRFKKKRYCPEYTRRLQEFTFLP